MKSTRVLFLWARYSGYMAACWRMLAQRPGFKIDIVAVASKPQDKSDPTFDASILEGLSPSLITHADAQHAKTIIPHLPELQPDIIVVSGWQFPGYVELLRQKRFSSVPLIVCSDNPIRHSWRQRLGRYRIGWLLRRADRIFVPGESGFQLMRFWNVPHHKIVKGVYGVDESALSSSVEIREQKGWPKNFLFTGRYSARKGVDLLVEAYRHYRQSCDQPWGLVCCGRGELASNLADQPGVIDRGFVQPEDLPEVFGSASAFVLASRSDAWPLSIVEAAVSGLPILCTSACGSSAELVRDLYNGRIVPPNDVEGLLEAMNWFHGQSVGLKEMGARSLGFGRAYSSAEWTIRWERCIQEVLH